MNTVIILLGGNIGDTLFYLKESIRRLENHNCVITKQSEIYETEAWGVENQNNYYNQALEISTSLSPNEVLILCQKIENQLGRIRKERWGARTIDIDLIFYNQLIIDTPTLTIPHPRYHLRNFVLFPLADVIPDYVCPIFKTTILKIVSSSLDQSQVKTVDPVIVSF